MTNSRRKGRDGQSEFARLLRDRDWQDIDDTRAGKITEDIIAKDQEGTEWSIEVKKTKAISLDHKRQAMKQAKARRLPWMLASKIFGSSSWLIQRQGRKPCLWHMEE